MPEHPENATTPTPPTGVRLHVSDETLTAWLRDDLGPECHDVTSESLFGAYDQGRARIVAREPLVVSGLEEALRIFRIAGVRPTGHVEDGDDAGAGAVLARVEGATWGILSAERTALNILCRASGIASLTRDAQRRVHEVNPACRISATRKTTPGFRVIEKKAVLHGGGDPHRYGLFDQALIKDNHRAAGGDTDQLIAKVRKNQPGLLVQVEVETRADAIAAADAGADWILVDNQDPDSFARIAQAVREKASRVKIEASGGIRVEEAHRWAAHADRVSCGALTLSAPAKDIGLDWHTP